MVDVVDVAELGVCICEAEDQVYRAYRYAGDCALSPADSAPPVFNFLQKLSFLQFLEHQQKVLLFIRTLFLPAVMGLAGPKKYAHLL